MSSTAYAKRTQYKPIDFFYRGVVDTKQKKVQIVDAFQILNDRYLGRMSVCNYFFIAENSVRINELNIIALDELKNYHLVMRENFYIPETVKYLLPVTTRFLESDRDFEVLIATLKENGYKKTNLIIAFYCNTLTRIDDEAKKRYERLRRSGYKICVSGFGEEFNSLDIFARFNFDYLRLEAQYFDADPSKKKVLNMLVKFCASNKIGLIMEGVDSPSQVARFKREGVKLLTGKAVSKLSRWVTNEFLGLAPLDEQQRIAYEKKLQKELLQQTALEQAELDALRRAAAEKAKSDAENGRVMPGAPRPELIKSPYQIRLEQQKLAAKKAALARAERQAARAEYEKTPSEEQHQQRLIREMSPQMFEGGLQSALAVSFAAEEKRKLNLGLDSDGVRAEAKPDSTIGKKSSDSAKAKKNAESADAVSKEDQKPALRQASDKKSKKDITPDTDKEQKLLNEVKNSGLFGQLNSDGAMGGFGVHLRIDDDEDEAPIEGHYNDKGQWVDEDGYVYNGYFDDKGEWVDYETFNARQEGHYNDEGQWVDAEGKVYDGYFDEDGRWIDYTYIDEAGEKADNGYYDAKIKKWVPFGYFDENGKYIKFQ